ncbi:hypothetical protein KPL35_09820 [Clostridium sp. CF011]|uniref:hypothetical protein n=1 Tax=Clostridium sp. CF011 TaxID=2843318 RepID=UPI001C0E249D|nr:hypothetical protein [Clostridium sp. CF011]MBU3092376.1 hypothetical protein [Clostridium sp. CF011]WAG68388.1 hypothetical protein LL036_09735 [Clostridium sp. CF011]
MSEMVLRMPSSYVEVERDEMEYVDGGWLGVDVMPVWVAGAAFNTAIGLAVGGVGVGAISSYIRKVGVSEAKKIFNRSIKTKLLSIGAGALAGGLGRAVDFAINAADIGNTVAKYLDNHDSKPGNGWLSI